MSTYNTTVSKIEKKRKNKNRTKIKIPAQQSKPSFTPLTKVWRPSKKIIEYNQRAHQQISKSQTCQQERKPRRPTDTSHMPRPPQESIYPNDQGIRKNPKPPSPRQHPYPSRLGLPPRWWMSPTPLQGERTSESWWLCLHFGKMFLWMFLETMKCLCYSNFFRDFIPYVASCKCHSFLKIICSPLKIKNYYYWQISCCMSVNSLTIEWAISLFSMQVVYLLVNKNCI